MSLQELSVGLEEALLIGWSIMVLKILSFFQEEAPLKRRPKYFWVI